MPELPEVETVKNSILAQVGNKTIREVKVNHPAVIKNTSPSQFIEYIEGETIENMERRGKYMVFCLSNNKFIVLHLRMTGQCVYFDDKLPELNHCHVVIYFDKGGLYYRDVRRFGGFWVGDDITALGSGIEHLGPEPLGDDFTPEYLETAVKRKQAPIKSILLDQSIVAGIGNIYADEIAFAAGVNPLKPGNTLNEDEIKALVYATKDVLSLSIANRGTTFSDYRDGYGDKGNFQNYLKIFQRGGEPCIKCGTIIQKTQCGGRTTSYCPKCQPFADRQLIIGLTGGIACGKTLAAQCLEGLGAEIIDADIVAREVVEPGSKVLTKIAAAFGEKFINPDGTLNRGLLRSEVFSSPEKVKELNSIAHPAIRRKVSGAIRSSESQIIVLVAPLLLEAKFNKFCHEVWLIHAQEEQQLQRLINRDGIDEKTAKNIISSQWPYSKKARYADVIIDNSRSTIETEEQIKEEYIKRKNNLND